MRPTARILRGERRSARCDAARHPARVAPSQDYDPGMSDPGLNDVRKAEELIAKLTVMFIGACGMGVFAMLLGIVLFFANRPYH